MPGRNFNADQYRFGFNGKEMDNEVLGNGNQYDYGFRIYNPRIGKFLSVDPLTKSYPMLTPYQFSSNRPIDGVDLDGLEYYTIHVKVHDNTGYSKIKIEDHTNLSDAQIREVHGMSSKRFHRRYSKSFRERGRGILYVYHHYNDGKYVGTRSQMDLTQDGLIGSLTRHGIYYGSECITINGLQDDYSPSNQTEAINYYDFSFDPIDEVDALAKQHDIDYTEFSEGYEGWFRDERTAEADIEFVKGLGSYLLRSTKKGYRDKYTNKAPSREAKAAAMNAIQLFTNVAAKKLVESGVKKSIKNSKNKSTSYRNTRHL